jgi:hypothetical protein
MSIRINSGYELKEINKLDEAYRKSLSAVVDVSDYEACLLPKDPSNGLTIKLVDHHTFSFLQNLNEQNDLEHKSVKHFILDRILEIETEKGFITGPEAIGLLGQYDQNTNNLALSYIDKISREAIDYGLQLKIDDALSLSARLYFYNRRPYPPFIAKEHASNTNSGLDFLGIEDAVKQLNHRCNWKTQKLPDEYDVVWKSWKKSGEKSGGIEKYKLYISCLYEEIPILIDGIVKTLSDGDCYQFKLGRRIIDLMRPDYFIVYFKSFEGMRKTANTLMPLLDGTTPHGVPFTCPLNEAGTLSWGIDPPKGGKVSGWMTDDLSWRIWITNRLATSILNAKQSLNDNAAIKNFALQRLEMDGINIQQWCRQKHAKDME